MRNIIRYDIQCESNERENRINIEPEYIPTKKCSLTKKIIIGIISVISIGIIITLCVIFIPKKKSDKPEETSIKTEIIIPPPSPPQIDLKLGSEFNFTNKEGSLQRIFIKQKYQEDRMIDGEKITTFSTKNTNYDIYIISEKDSDEENKNFYDKIYECAISIQSECFSSSNEDCQPEKRLDLSNSNRRMRNIDESNNSGKKLELKDMPIPFCLFNMTNNDAIISIKCPQSLSETKIKKIILDLYFFRPPGIKRLTKENINSTITRKTEGNRKYIRETNGDICDIENAQLSFCTTDMNTTTDLDNNILSYDEFAFMNVTLDNNNYYYKSKTTNLIDETNKIENYDVNEYKKNLDKLIEKFNPYLKYQELFSKENFEEVYHVSKQGMNSFNDMRRNLQKYEENNMILKENNYLNVFTPESGITVDFTLLNNAGINTDFMEADNKFYIENNLTEDISQSQESSKNLKQILKDLIILSDAGNHKATELYQKTNITFENLIEEITKKISFLNENIKYKDLSDIFDSTLSFEGNLTLPYVLIQEMANLKNKLEEIITNIDNGGIKNHIKILNQNIYDYIEESRKIITSLFNNLSELSKSLSSPKSILTEISTYYLDNTTTSYITIIKQAENILLNYYKDEFNLIKPKVDKILEKFEEKMDNSVEKEMEKINNLYEKLENKSFIIKNSNENELKTTLNNLYYIKNFIKELKEKIIKKVKNEMDIKSSGYFISDYDLDSNQDSFSIIIDKALKVSNLHDNNELIDITFDEVMKNIKNNFTYILKYMDKQKEEIFPLNENVLQSSYFDTNFQNGMRDKIIDEGVQIFNKIKRENNYYLEAKQREIDKFLQNDKEELNNIILELDNMFSIVKMEELANLFENGVNSFLEKTKNEIIYNGKLSDEYFKTLSDEKELLKLLRNYHVDEKHLPYCISRVPLHEVYLTDFVDKITSITKTQGYLSKYSIFKEHFEKSGLYINNQLYAEILLEYKNLMLKIRENLQLFKSNKLSDKYPDLDELSFINEHIRIVDNFYHRFDEYISDNIFNNKYIELVKKFKNEENEEINNILNDIESYHQIINGYKLGNDYNYDLCLKFQRKITYTCVNGVVSTKTESKEYCLPAASVSSNYLNLTDHSFDSDFNIIIFRDKLKEFNDSLSEKINLYTSKINNLKQSLLNIEKETIDQKITLDYMTPIRDYVEQILSDKYRDHIINSTYIYYQSSIKTKLQDLLDDITNHWYKYFDDIYTDIENNLPKFNNSILELSNMMNFYISILSSNITRDYFDSIEMQQKNELNYTITYYYNILLKLVQSAYQYTISKLPMNPVGFNNIIEIRRKEVNEVFTYLINKIKESQNYALNFENQIYIAQVPETNFFDVNDILRNNVIDTQKNLNQKYNNIRKLKNNKLDDEFSLTSRFYLENSESGRQIIELYEQIDEKVFVYLNLAKFKQLLIDNWIFDQDEFITSLKALLYNSNLEVKNELSVEKVKYIKSLEEEITRTYNKDDIARIINKLYKEEIIDLNINQINIIKENINDILNKFQQEMTKEANNLKEKLNSLNKDYSVIKNRLKNYIDNIIQRLNDIIFGVINKFNQDIMDKIFTNFFEKNLNQYISESEKTITELNIGKIKLLSNSYNIGQIIHNIIKDLCEGYKTFITKEISSNYNKYYLIIKNNSEIDNLSKLINDKINENYNTILLEELKKVATNEIGIQGYDPYDFSDDIVTDINEFIDTKLNNIKTIIESTKGENYDFDMKGWKKMDFSRVYQTIIQNCNSLKEFIYSEKDDEKEHVDTFLKEIMTSNFNDLLNNIIPSFGNQFFERIIKYNENFKISSLYNTLNYCLVTTIAYYRSLQASSNNIKALTKDLKLKIYSLNDLDITAQKRNNEVLELLTKKVDEFIIDSKDFLIERYIQFFRNDVSIETNFTGIVRDEILDNLIELRDNFKNNYLQLVNDYFKDKLITSYSDVMNQKTREMVLRVEELREGLRVKIDDLFSVEPDEVLNDINNKLNNTLDSIYNYNSHFNTFKISENLNNFLYYYGIDNVQPKFNGLLDILSDATKNGIIDTIEQNSEDYSIYYDKEDYIEKVNNFKKELINNYIKNINDSIFEYGIDEYPDNLENEISRQTNIHEKKDLRLLNEEEINNYHKEKIADKAIDETFNKILTSSKNAETFINTLEKFDDFNNIIEENIKKVNISYKNSLKRIKDNKYDEEINKNLTLKLSELKESTLDYYNKIKNSFYELKNYLQKSIYDINYDLNQCANITYNTFAKIYDNYTNIENINKVKKDTIQDISDSKVVDNQAKITTVNYTISNIKKDTQFIFSVDYEDGEIKKPRVKATIINKSRPSNIEIKFINGEESRKLIETITAEINDINFTMDIYFSTASKDLYVKTITNFDSFKYSKEFGEIVLEETEYCDYDLGFESCYITEDYSDYKEIIPKKDNIIGQKIIIEESKVHENTIFNNY